MLRKKLNEVLLQKQKSIPSSTFSASKENIADPTEIADIFNKHFLMIGDHLADQGHQSEPEEDHSRVLIYNNSMDNVCNI